MNVLTTGNLLAYWSMPEISVNLVVFLNILGAMLLGMVVGYERSYHGRAAGMRTYGLVCMASAALIVLAAFPGYWFAGHTTGDAPTDPTRIIQGIVTGIGFLGAGVIMKDGLNITGLTTAASLWASSAIGILVGIGFYAAAILLTLLSVLCMVGVARLESWLPSRPALAFSVRFGEGRGPDEAMLRQMVRSKGYHLIGATLAVHYFDGRAEWRFVAVERRRGKSEPLARIAAELTAMDGVESFQLSHARN